MKKEAWKPAAPHLSVTMAIKALAAGTANDEQQKRALKWIIEDLCGAYDLSYRPESDRDTVFAEGRRFVGLQIVKEINIRMETRNG